MEDIYRLLHKLALEPGPSGDEGPVALLIAELWRPIVSSVEIDSLGNVIAVARGSGTEPRQIALLTAHMDELGLMVKQLVSFPDEDGAGFIRISGIGGVDPRQLFGQRVWVHPSPAEAEPLAGVIGALPGRMLSQVKANEAYDLEVLVVDVGLSFTELRQLISVGDFISFRRKPRKLLNERLTGKSLDNRAAVAAVTLALRLLSEREHSWDVLAVATVQEETRLLGAASAAHRIWPDIAVVVDTTFGKGPGANDEKVFELDGGPALGMGPNVHPGMTEALRRAAEALEIDVHTEVHGRHSGTEAFAVQVARHGIPTGLVGIPVRYMHTLVETVALRDVERVSRLLAHFFGSLDKTFTVQLRERLR